MKTKELIDAVAEQTGMTKADTKKAFDALVSTVLGAVSKKEEVDLGSLGKIVVVHKEAGTARNPATGAQMDVPAKDVPKFKFAKAIKDAANS